MPTIRLGGEAQPWRDEAPEPTARLRSRRVEVGGIETRAISAPGEGAPAVLLHGWLDNADTWLAVLDRLAVAGRPAIAYDLPGFGTAPPLGPGSVLDQLVGFAATAVDDAAEAAGSEVVVAGNSLGGWVALELAAVEPVASINLISPAGLWRGDTPLYNRASLRMTRWLTRHGGRLLSPLVAFRVGRAVVFGQVTGRPGRMTPDQAREAIRAMGTGPGFDATLRATAQRHYRSGRPIDAPVTVAFGSRDRLLLPRQSRHVDRLPAGARVTELPGCGHVPMTDDPAAVAGFVVSSIMDGRRDRDTAVS
jgi:pimeloyl-ACP methyl ester carboxylesterase